jgi:hypothetical protein
MATARGAGAAKSFVLIAPRTVTQSPRAAPYRPRLAFRRIRVALELFGKDVLQVVRLGVLEAFRVALQLVAPEDLARSEDAGRTDSTRVISV